MAQAIADGLGTTIGQLRKMGSEGELTAQKVVEAIQKEQKTLRDEFSQTTPRLEKGWTDVSNAAVKFFGVLDDKLDVTSTMGAVLSDMADGVDSLTDALKSMDDAASHAVNRVKEMQDIAARLSALNKQESRMKDQGMPTMHLRGQRASLETRLAMYGQTYGPLYESDARAQRAGRYVAGEIEAMETAPPFVPSRPSTLGSNKTGGKTPPTPKTKMDVRHKTGRVLGRERVRPADV